MSILCIPSINRGNTKNKKGLQYPFHDKIEGMTQKPSPEKMRSVLLQTFDPTEIADKQLRQTVEALLNQIEHLNCVVKDLKDENQKLRDEINRLKGEQGKPQIKANKNKEQKKNYSSESERKIPKKHHKSSKNSNLKIDRQEILKYPVEKLPQDAQFKGYQEVIVQDISLSTDNILFRKEKFYSPETGKTYIAPLPPAYEGQFGPALKALVMSLYYGGNMTRGKLSAFLADIGISISAGQLSNLLIKNSEKFEIEVTEIYKEGLRSSPWQHLDQTGVRVKGVNHTCNIICNPLYTVYQTTPNKDRLSVLRVFQNNQELMYLFNQSTYELLERFKISSLWQNQLLKLPQEQVVRETELNDLLDQYCHLLNSQSRTRIKEAAAIAFYHQQTQFPVVQTLVCDDAPQFKLLTNNLALCWIHEGRHYKKLSPCVPSHQKIQEDFLGEFWDYYRELLLYKGNPCEETQQSLRRKFLLLFGTPTGYQQLDERKTLTMAKLPELLLVLEHPELPLHNNPAELGARTMVQRRNISYATQTSEGTKAIDIFISLVATTRKLGISFFEYIRDRISNTEKIPNLAIIIQEQSNLHSFGLSWQMES